jgi:hypothetical protein
VRARGARLEGAGHACMPGKARREQMTCSVSKKRVKHGAWSVTGAKDTITVVFRAVFGGLHVQASHSQHKRPHTPTYATTRPKHRRSKRQDRVPCIAVAPLDQATIYDASGGASASGSSDARYRRSARCCSRRAHISSRNART